MIEYSLGDLNCKLSWKDFLSLEIGDIKKYKSDFQDFYALYEFIDKNIKKITHLLFDGREYFLEKGVLHNLYGPAYIRYTEEGEAFMPGTSYRFYIDGKLVYDELNDNRGCKKLSDFLTKEIFHYESITDKQTGRDPVTGIFHRRIEGVDYKKHYIDLQTRIKLDQRKKKLKVINDY